MDRLGGFLKGIVAPEIGTERFHGAATAMMLAPPPANAMSGYRWKFRPVVVLAGAGGDAALVVTYGI